MRTYFTKSKYKEETLYHPNKQLLINTIISRDWRAAAKLVRNDEMYSKIPDVHDNLPIHLVVKYGGTKELLNLLLHAYPECIKIRDSDGNLPGKQNHFKK